ncbi:MAG TPA: GDP-mannose 4,6-dehydratase [Candidatus Omnitrophota bacterium]|nr:GDP-mannose 4,6-dehydratase [Candidatus Omnitrophota bacterium]HRZ15173.1 GDP-mannose 4,6-dehydratase [Candidatus Omnitrophota bacterium]
MKKSFWKGKRVLVTGYEGFLGSWLSRLLLEAGARVVGLDIRTHRAKTILTAQEFARITVVKGSVENYRLLERLIRTHRIETIFHLAAMALVGDCLKKPVKAFATNIKGTWNILEAARQSETVRSVVVASSDKAYGTHKRLPYKETFALQGDHPYDVSKSCTDLLAATYRHTYKLPVCVTRCGNLYGPGDFNFSRLVPDACRCALKGKPLLIRSDGTFVRDYVFVKDIALAYMLLAKKMSSGRIAGEAFNFSDEKPLSVLKMVQALYAAAGKKPQVRILNQAKFEIRDQYLDSAKARRMLGWKPRYPLKEALAETLEWYKHEVTDDQRR